jgi:hypothetical protein
LKISISNTGEKIAHSVVLKLPENGLIEKVNEGVGYDIYEDLNKIIINEINPQETITVLFWAKVSSTNLIPNNIYLSHSEGSGKIKIKYPVHIFWVLMDRYSIPILLLFCSAVGLAFLFFRKRKRDIAVS